MMHKFVSFVLTAIVYCSVAHGTQPIYQTKQKLLSCEHAIVTLSDKADVTCATTISRFNVELARTATEQRIGLSEHLSLNEDAGMLFVYKQRELLSFWMKGMHFPIDIIWISDHRVVHITPEVAAPNSGVEDSALSSYSSIQSVEYVLEIRSGRAKEVGIRVGDFVQILFY